MAFASSLVDRFGRQPVAAKVPEIGALFWVVKLLTTAGGEATSDYLALRSIALAGAVELVIFLVALWWQFNTRRYVALAYWALALAIAIFGTGVSDGLHKVVGVPYAGTTAFWAIVLAAIFWLWYRAEGTLSIHSIVTRRREAFYWATVFATFALGTALGDFTATTLKFGYLSSGIAFGVIILIPLVAWRLGANSVVAFWAAYVVTRPLGASFADYTSKSRSTSGLGLGDGPTAAVALAVIGALVLYLAVTRKDIQSPEEAVRYGGGPAARPRAEPDAAGQGA
jgi:uncharacterized membrane-anchored protein